jgi:hypothetical protein
MKKMMMTGLFLAVTAGLCAGQMYWKKTYGGLGDHLAMAATPSTDGNIFVTGYGNRSLSNMDVYILKMKPNGDTLWAKYYGGSSDDKAYAITPTTDGNCIVAGYASWFGAGGDDAYFLKIKPDGDTLWTRTYGGAGTDFANAIVSASDGNCIAAGWSNSFTSGMNAYVLKIKPNGDTAWTKVYGGVDFTVANAIAQTQDGDFIIAGGTHSNSTLSYDVFLSRINSNGDIVWTKLYGGSHRGYIQAITPTPDGNFIVAGNTESLVTGGFDVYLMKIKPNGDTLWTKSYGGPDFEEAYAITAAENGNFLVAGYTSSNPYLLKIKPNGDTLWTRKYVETGDFRAIMPAGDGKFIIAGSTKFPGIYNFDVLVFSFIDNCYAYKNTPFTFKIPVYGDSLNHGYTPLNVPSGMTVSLGGTISWTPKTDSIYMDHVEFLVSDDMGKKDTLTFNVFVNSSYHPSKVTDPLFLPRQSPLPNEISVRNISPEEVRFSLTAGSKSLAIYDVRGQLLEKISVFGNSATWRPKHSAGRYFAKAIWENREAVKPFVLMR